jgi:DNA-binding MarR family transcriptional regulator
MYFFMIANYHAIISANVRYAKITPNAKLLYGEIFVICGTDKYCIATNKDFAELYSVRSDTISTWIQELVKQGFIKTETNQLQGNKRKIYLCK